MEAFSILSVPEYIMKKNDKTIIGCNIDYKRFNIRSAKVLDNLFINFIRANNITNSNVAYDGEVAFIRAEVPPVRKETMKTVKFDPKTDTHLGVDKIRYKRIGSPRGVAHQIVISFENIGPVPIAFIEQYGKGQGLNNAVARIDFYGAFFHFYDWIPHRYQALYLELMYQAELHTSEIDGKKVNVKGDTVRVTRVDIAFDFAQPFPQNGGKWITPCANSKRDVELFRHRGKFNSYGYLSNKNSWYGVRMYNKLIDIDKLGKWNWYGGISKLPKEWTRVEFEFYPPYSSDYSDDELRVMCEKRLLRKGNISLGMKFRPTFDFKIVDAYAYFEKYAKNHGITMDQLIDEIVAYHVTLVEEKNKLDYVH